jgi:glycosyltransferase involved in cell wall biosynthesis
MAGVVTWKVGGVRVLLVSDFFPPVRGGLEHHVEALSQALQTRGHDVAVATLTSDAVLSAGVRGYAIPALATRLLPHEDQARPFHPPLPDPLAHLGLSRLLNDFRPDVVHGHSWLAVSLPRTREVPLVLTAHDYGLVCQLRTLYKPSGVVCGGPSAQCPSCGSAPYGRAKSAALSAGTAMGRRWLRPDRIIAVSRSVERALTPHVAVPVDVVPNFILDPKAGATPPEPDDGARSYVMFAGDPSVHKGIEVLLDCWRAATPPVAELLLAVTREAPVGLPPGVRVVTLQRSEMAAAWAGALVAVVPSLWPDPSPTVAIEAMAAGTPVVASNIGGLPDMVVDGVNGYLVQPGDSVELKRRIDELLQDDVLRRRLGSAARDRSKQFLAGSVVPRIEDIYEQSVAAGR